MSTDSQARTGVRPAGRRRRILRLGLVAAGLAATALTGGQASALPTPLHQAAGDCAAPAGGQPNGKQFPGEPAMTVSPDTGYTATLQTSCGTVTIALDAAHAPRTVNSFVFLAAQQYFDHTACHRLTTQGIYVLQCGDPTASGRGGPGYRIPDENLAGATYPAGTVAMANAGPNTGGSQFFLVYQDSQLPASYTPFGRITGGLDVLQGIAAGGTRDGSPDGIPADGVVLDAVTASES